MAPQVGRMWAHSAFDDQASTCSSASGASESGGSRAHSPAQTSHGEGSGGAPPRHPHASKLNSASPRPHERWIRDPNHAQFSEKQCQHRRDNEAWFLRNMIRCGDARREINCHRLQTLTVAINPSLAELRKLPAPPDLEYPSYLRTRQCKSRWVVSVQSHENIGSATPAQLE